MDKVVYGYRRKRYRPPNNDYKSEAATKYEKLTRQNRFQIIGLYVFLAVIVLAILFAVFSL